MRNLVFVVAVMVLSSFTNWQNNLQQAEQTAAKEHKYILLNFSGSDWCGPCIRMHKEIFDNADFQQFASSALVMVNADFPRNKKNQLSKEQQALNNKMADAYNSQGSFPYTVLLDANGKLVKAWDGYPKEDVPSFIEDIKEAMNASGNQ